MATRFDLRHARLTSATALAAPVIEFMLFGVLIAYGGIATEPAAAFTAVLMSLFLVSLVGLPPLGGFWAKVFLMTAMSQLGVAGSVLIAVLLFNTLLSLYYYLRPVLQMIRPADTQARPVFAPGAAGLALLVVCAVPLLWTGVVPGYAHRLATDYATLLTSDPAPPPGRTPARPPQKLAQTPSVDNHARRWVGASSRSYAGGDRD